MKVNNLYWNNYKIAIEIHSVLIYADHDQSMLKRRNPNESIRYVIRNCHLNSNQNRSTDEKESPRSNYLSNSSDTFGSVCSVFADDSAWLHEDHSASVVHTHGLIKGGEPTPP
jgi:hypothetical protein